jgi:hypothetical protein
MNLIVRLIFFLGIGILDDILVVLYYTAIQKKYRFRASILAFVLPAIGGLLTYNAIETRNPWLLIAYAIGNGVGTYTACGGKK